MAKFKVTVVYTGEVDIEIEADNEADAILQAGPSFDELSAVELEANIVDVHATEAVELDEDGHAEEDQ